MGNWFEAQMKPLKQHCLCFTVMEQINIYRQKKRFPFFSRWIPVTSKGTSPLPGKNVSSSRDPGGCLLPDTIWLTGLDNQHFHLFESLWVSLSRSLIHSPKLRSWSGSPEAEEAIMRALESHWLEASASAELSAGVSSVLWEAVREAKRRRDRLLDHLPDVN